MTEQRNIITTTFDWEGITLLISYEPDWLNMGSRNADYVHAHLEIRSVRPEKAVLPITDTGYLSHFLCPDEVDQTGGPAAYVKAWLDDAARSRAWRVYQECSRQLSLF